MSKPDKFLTTPMADIPGDPSDYKGDSGSIFDGVPGIDPSSGGIVPELTYVTNDKWADVKPIPLGGKRSGPA